MAKSQYFKLLYPFSVLLELAIGHNGQCAMTNFQVRSTRAKVLGIVLFPRSLGFDTWAVRKWTETWGDYLPAINPHPHPRRPNGFRGWISKYLVLSNRPLGHPSITYTYFEAKMHLGFVLWKRTIRGNTSILKHDLNFDYNY